MAVILLRMILNLFPYKKKKNQRKVEVKEETYGRFGSFGTFSKNNEFG